MYLFMYKICKATSV